MRNPPQEIRGYKNKVAVSGKDSIRWGKNAEPAMLIASDGIFVPYQSLEELLRELILGRTNEREV
jgi:hypothetical protein